ncbi:MAG: GNAT family N-acetyltransferase, partial [Angustibacter sp.]
HRQARSGQSIPLAVTWNGELAGQLTVSGITGGSLRSAFLGYWISRDRAGRGIIPTAVALVCDYCFFERSLHRMEINVRPENSASLSVVTKLGFREEGLRLRYLHIDGQWRDHRSFALTADELPSGGLISRALRARPRDS